MRAELVVEVVEGGVGWAGVKDLFGMVELWDGRWSLLVWVWVEGWGGRGRRTNSTGAFGGFPVFGGNKSVGKQRACYESTISILHDFCRDGVLGLFVGIGKLRHVSLILILLLCTDLKVRVITFLLRNLAEFMYDVLCSLESPSRLYLLPILE